MQGEAQWADSVPRLAQFKMLENLENSGFAHIGKAMDGFTPDLHLVLDIRSFEILPGSVASADRIFAKWLGADGKIIPQRSFLTTAPATALEGPTDAAALSEAFQTVAREIVTWARTTL